MNLMLSSTSQTVPLVLLLLSTFQAYAARIEDLPSDENLSNTNTSSSLVWQPLRATFRPLNRQAPPPPPPAPVPELIDLSFETTTTSTTTTTEAPISSIDIDEEQPTRVPLSRFRPTRPPSVDAQSQPANSRQPLSSAASGSHLALNQSSISSANNYRITGECFECICEASTSCNARSRCQTSDVRHTRCGLYLISYDQWLESGLSRQLVTREALARDVAADERAFYECVTERECAERLLSIYMSKKALDCDKDGRIDCYDVAAIHQGGSDQCASESLLESQYWSDFNACFGFGR